MYRPATCRQDSPNRSHRTIRLCVAAAMFAFAIAFVATDLRANTNELVAQDQAAPQEDAAPAPLVYVKLSSGREFTAVADPRSSADKLWLRFETRSAKVLRPVNWDHISELHVDGVQVPIDDFRANVQDFAAGELNIWEFGPDQAQPGNRQNIDPWFSSGMSHADAAEFVLGTVPRVAAISADVSLGNWDGDVEADGLLVTLHPTSSQGWLIPASGTLEVTLFAPQSSKVTSHQAIRKLGRWSIPVNTADFVAGSPRYKLNFQAIHPEFDLEYSHLGLANVKFVVPGSGVFEASSNVRVRAFSPVRDWLQREGRPRFLSMERVARPQR